MFAFVIITLLVVMGGCEAVSMPPSGDASLLPDASGTDMYPDSPPGTARLTVTRIGDGAGTITSVVPGIDCGSDCFEDFVLGAEIELTIAMASGSSFAGWSGACSGFGTCVVDVDAPVEVTANFDCSPGSLTFGFSASPQLMTLPSCVNQIVVDATGASGGLARYSTSYYGTPGFGGRVSATIPVTPGDTYLVYVGGAGANGGAGGFNGGGNGGLESTTQSVGGGGGGASDVRRNGSSLGDRVIVAGGGGGAAVCSYYFYDGGNGGDLFAGGAPYGCGGTPPSGGTQSSGGIGGFYPSGCSAQSGLMGTGANGCSPGGSGGGGGGFFGGGGGARQGGGGGSSFTTTTAYSVTHEQGVQSGNGLVTISW